MGGWVKLWEKRRSIVVEGLLLKMIGDWDVL